MKKTISSTVCIHFFKLTTIMFIRNLLALLLCLGSFTVFAQFDLGIQFNNYSEGEFILNDTILYDFTITNNGDTNISSSIPIYMSNRINGTYYSLDLSEQVTHFELPSDLAPGEGISIDAGFLIGSQVIDFFPGDTLTSCLVIFGPGEESVDYTGVFPMDKNPEDNVSCIAYTENTTILLNDLSINLDNYTDNELSYEEDIDFTFTITNYGPEVLSAGDSLFVSLNLNGLYYSADLSTQSTAIVLPEDIPVDGTFNMSTGSLNGPQTLTFFPGSDTLNACIIVWGIGSESIDFSPEFPTDSDPINNISCMTFTEAPDAVLEEEYQVKYYPNPASHTINFEFENEIPDFIEISDFFGKSYAKIEIKQRNTSVDLSQFSNGIYLFSQIKDNQYFNHKKIIITK